MNNKMKMMVGAAALFTALFAQAATLIDPTSAIASSATSGKVASDAINEDEMNFTGDENDYSNWTMDPGGDATSSGDTWMSDSGANTYSPWLIIDLGATYNLETISIWNLNPANANFIERSAKTVNIYTSTSGMGSNVANSDTAFNSTGWTSLTTGLTVTQNPSNTTIAAPNGLLTGLTGVQARYVAFEVTAVYGTINHRKRAAISEVQFFRAAEGTVVSIK